MGHDEKTDKIFHAIMTAPREKLIDLITALMEKATERKREADTARSEVARLTAEVEARKSGSDIWHRAAIEAQDERDALRAEVEAMRALLADIKEERRFGYSMSLAMQDRVDDALRARKVGG